MIDLSLKGKHALVGGASRGIGRASAEALASLGASVTCVSRTASDLEKVTQGLNTTQGQAHQYIAANYDRPDELREMIKGRFDDQPVSILINNTGGPADGTASDASLEEYRIAFNRHVVCNQVLLQEILPGMKSSGYGRIINVISTSVKQPIPGLGVSNTIRGAVASWAKTLASELGPFGITVNNVLPGFTTTDRLQEIVDRVMQTSGKTTEQVLETMANSVPLRRIADASEVANAVAFLASPAASYINGINVPVDGGRTSSL